MSSVSAFISAMTEIDGSTLFLITAICGSMVWIVRNHVSSVFVLVFMFPVAMITSLVAYQACLNLSLFNIKNMGEWLIWTIIAATVGAMATLGLTVLLSAMLDKDQSGSTATAR
jgi:hypothetical protein